MASQFWNAEVELTGREYHPSTMDGIAPEKREWSEGDPVVDYYDSDHPWSGDAAFTDDYSRMIGWGLDEKIYSSCAAAADGPILELCCGTGRVSLAMAKGTENPLTCVDFSEPMLRRFRERLTPALAETITVTRGDATSFSLERSDFALVVMAYNSFPLLRTAEAQMAALRCARSHLRDGGLLVLDCDNAHHVSVTGKAPAFAFQRFHKTRGHQYSKWIGAGPMRSDQQITLYGWYDEIAPTGALHRRHWSSKQRPAYASELVLMCQAAGFREAALYGPFPEAPFAAQSSRFVVKARA